MWRDCSSVICDLCVRGRDSQAAVLQIPVIECFTRKAKTNASLASCCRCCDHPRDLR